MAELGKERDFSLWFGGVGKKEEGDSHTIKQMNLMFDN